MLLRGLVVGLILLLVGCGTTQRVPVADRTRPAQKSTPPSYYTVRKGDTLYSIAWRYGLDFRRVARLNKISREYRIYPGQRLRLTGSVSAQKVSKVSPSRKTKASKTPSHKVKPKSTTVRKKSSTTVKQTRTAGNQSAKQVTKPVKTVQKANSPKVGSTSLSKNSAKVGKVRWQWPTNGRVTESFRTRGKVNKGINLAGRLGDPVFAAASGEVVYAGSGLLGYGNLIIINHNGLYMSAYAHNNRMFVKERDRVGRGDKIAEVGNSGTDRYMLHFEIRRDGKPVNPAKYLPKR